MTPLRLVFGLAWPVTLRRLLGLFAFTYALIHFSVWIVVDHFFDWPTMADDLVKRPFMTAGMGALLMLIPLAATSTAAMVKRLGGAARRRPPPAGHPGGGAGGVPLPWPGHGGGPRARRSCPARRL